METLCAVVLARKGRDWVGKPQYEEWFELRLVKNGRLRFIHGRWSAESGERVTVIDEISLGHSTEELFRLYAKSCECNAVTERAREIANEFQTKARQAFVEHLSATKRGKEFLETIRDYLSSFQIPSLHTQMCGVGRGHQPWGWKACI